MEISNGPRSTFSLNALLLAALLALIWPALGRGEDFVRQWTDSQFVYEQGTVGAVSAVTRTPDGDLVACGRGGVSNSREFFVARYAAETGAVRWKKQSFPGLGPNGTFYSLGTDADGNVFMSGIDETAASGTIAVVKLRGGDGAELWRRNLPGVWGFGAMTPAGDFAITTSRVTAGVQELWTAVLAGSDGATRWERVVVDASQRQFDARQIQVDPAGNIAVATNLTVLSYGPTGAIRWQSSMGAADLALDPAGNVVLILDTWQVAKLAGTDGALLWIHNCNAGNARSTKVRKVAADGAGRVVVSYEATLNTHPFGEHFVVTTMLAAADGTPLWERQAPSMGPGFTTPFDVALEPGGDLWVLEPLTIFYAAGELLPNAAAVKLRGGDGTPIARFALDLTYDGSYQLPYRRVLALTPDGGLAAAGQGRGTDGAFAVFIVVNFVPTTPFASADNFSAISETGVTLRGRVNPHGLATVAHFEYGTTDAYGTILPITLVNDSGVTSEAVAAVLSGLAPGTRYHWRIVAVNSAGTITTPDATFVTLAGSQMPPGAAENWLPSWSRETEGLSPAYSANGGVLTDDAGTVFVMSNLNDGIGGYTIEGWNGYLAAYAPGDGSVLWERRLDGAAHDFDGAYFLLRDATGGLFVVGEYAVGGTFGLFAGKYSAVDGSTIWERRADTGHFGRTMRMGARVDSSGNLCVGYSADKSGGGRAFLLGKYAAHTGALLWERELAFSAGNLEIDVHGDIVIASSAPGLAGGLDLVVAKVGADGADRWTTRTPGYTHGADSISRVIALDADGNAVVTGSLAANAQPGQIFTAKYAAQDGALLWSASPSGPEFPGGEGTSVAVDAAGAVWVGGNVKDGSQYFEFRARYAGATGAVLWQNRSDALDLILTKTHPPVFDAAGNAWEAASAWPGRPVGTQDWRIRHTAASNGHLLEDLIYDSPQHDDDYIYAYPPLALTPDGGIVVIGHRRSLLAYPANRARLAVVKFVPDTPSVWTASASGFGPQSVTLHGRVNPHGNPAQAYFEYGPTEAYGSVAPVTLADGQAMTPQPVAAVLSGLENHTLYHYRLVAWNGAGTVVSPDATFSTSTPPQAVDDGLFTLADSGPATLAVLANDSEPDGESFHIVAITQPLHGTAAIGAGGASVSYDPLDDFAGADAFTYTVADVNGATATATVSVRAPDTVPPVIGSMGPFALVAELHNLAALPDYLPQAAMTDNVGVASATQSPPAGTLLRAGSFAVRLTALDAAGNVGTRDVAVMVKNGSTGLRTLARTGALLPPSLTTGALAGSRWARFGTPALSAAGDVAYSASWTGPVGPGEALFRQNSDATGFILRKGQRMQDGNRVQAMRPPFFGADEFLMLGVDVPPLLVPGLPSRAVLRFPVVDRTRVFFYHRESEMLPVDAGVRLERIRYFGTGGATVFVEGRLSLKFGDPRPTASDDGVLLAYPTDAAGQIRLREGDLLSTARGRKKMTAFKVLAAMGRMPGGGRTLPSDESALTLVLCEDGSTAVVDAGEGGPTVVLQPGDAVAADQPGVTWSSFSSPAAATLADMAVLGSVTDGTHTQRVIYAGLPSAHVLVAAEEDPAPVGADGVRYDTLRDPLYRGGTVAFAARLAGNRVRATNAEALMAGTPGALRLVARTGQIAPETGGAVYAAFPALALFHENWQRALWLGRLSGTGVDGTNDLALFAETGARSSRLLLREGMTLLGRKVKTFTTLPTVADSPDARRSANEAGEVVALLDFTDGTQAVVKLTVP